jgi:hypothetical protein
LDFAQEHESPISSRSRAGALFLKSFRTSKTLQNLNVDFFLDIGIEESSEHIHLFHPETVEGSNGTKISE